MKHALLAMALLGLTAFWAPARADEAAKKPAPNSANPAGQQQTYLGLGVETLSPVVSSQMPGIVPKGQGIVVTRVAKDSPAEKAGLHANDILLSYGNEKLTSPEQLSKLVRGDKPGHEVALSLIRGGKSMTCTVKLGERESLNTAAKPRVIRLLPEEQVREMFEEIGSKDGGPAWELFDSMKLTRLDAKRWRAEIDYRSTEGKKEHKSFEGTRGGLRKDIQADKDLPASERSHLLRALNLHEPVFEFHFPPLDKLIPDFGEEP